MSEAVFLAPHRRPRVYEAYEAPFPVPSSAEEAERQAILVYRAEIVNNNIIVRDPDHIQALYGKGYFGKGILSKARPDYSISDQWEKIEDSHLPVISMSKYRLHLSWARDVLLAQGLEPEAVDQTLQRLSQPAEPEHGEENGRDGEGEPAGSPCGGAARQGVCGEGLPSGAEQDSECPQAKRPRRQGDARFDPLAEIYPQEPERLDPQRLAVVKCSRHDDWLLHCGCRLQECHLEAETQQSTPGSDPGYERVLVEEEEEREEDEEGERARTRRRVCRVNPFRLTESLQLSLEEAFFLVYALGCLSVHYHEEPLSVSQLWEMFRCIQPHFDSTYIVYHYFRSKGWVPKPGVKYGSDFMLYRKGPPFYHASYSVVVQRVDGASQNASLRPFSWRSLAALSRVTGNVSKELMICYVIYPEDVSEEELRSPECMQRVRVQEIVVSRWISSRERIEHEDI